MLAERMAVEHVTAQGFEILGMNVRSGRYEVDILARDGSMLVIIEVRARGEGSLVRPLDSVDRRKVTRLRYAGRWLWRDVYSKDARFDRVRFDCVAITFGPGGSKRLEHIRAAF